VSKGGGMHILFLSPNFAPEVNAAATRQYEHCRRWAAAGHEVTVITPAPNWPQGKLYDGYRNHWKNVETVEGVRVVRVWTLICANQGFLLRTLSFVSYMLRAVLCACFVRDVDVIVASSPQFFGGLAGMFTRWFKRRPFVLEIRDIWPESIVAVGAMQRTFSIRLLEWLERKMYQSASHIVTVGDGYRDKLLERNVPIEKISIVSNGVDLSQWQPSPPMSDVRQKWNAEGKFVCAYVGTVGMAHGLEVMLHTAEKLESQGRSEVMFWVVGDGARRSELETEVKRKGLTNISFMGLVPKSEVRSVLAECDACLVHLRGTELFGTVVPSKIFEMMAMEKPIIMGVRGPAQEIVLEADAGLPMVPDDSDSLLDCIEQIAVNSSDFKQGRQYVATNYDRDDLAQRMLSILAEQAGEDLPTAHSTAYMSRKAA